MRTSACRLPLSSLSQRDEDVDYALFVTANLSSATCPAGSLKRVLTWRISSGTVINDGKGDMTIPVIDMNLQAVIDMNLQMVQATSGPSSCQVRQDDHLNNTTCLRISSTVSLHLITRSHFFDGKAVESVRMPCQLLLNLSSWQRLRTKYSCYAYGKKLPNQPIPSTLLQGPCAARNFCRVARKLGAWLAFSSCGSSFRGIPFYWHY